MNIAGKSLQEWQEFARRDDCLERMVPSDLRQVVGEVERLRAEVQAYKDKEAALVRMWHDPASQ